MFEPEIHPPRQIDETQWATLYCDSVRMMASSRAIYESIWRKYLKFLANPPLGAERLPRRAQSASQKDVGIYLAKLKEEGCTESHIVRVAKNLNRIYKWANDNKLALTNPAAAEADNRRENSDRSLPDALTASEEDRFIEHLSALNAERADWENVRDRAMQLLMLGAGLTPSEVRLLRATALKLDEVRPFVEVRSETNKTHERNAPIRADFVKDIRAWFNLRTGLPIISPLLFPNVKGEALNATTLYRKTCQVMTSAGITKDSAGGFVLRHTYAARALAEGQSEDAVMRALGTTTGNLHHYSLLNAPAGSRPPHYKRGAQLFAS